MLAIRLQRTGRSGHAQFRVIVQDSRFSPSGGRVVAQLGSYDPHTKTATIDGEQASKYLQNGAQPSDRVARLLQKEGVKLPAWVKLSDPKERTVRNPDKRRSTRPAEPEAPAAETPADETTPVTEEPADAPIADEPADVPAEPTDEPADTPADKPADVPAAEAPAAEPEAPAEAEAPAAKDPAEK